MRKIIFSFLGMWFLVFLTGCGLATDQSRTTNSLTIKGSDTEVQLVSNLAEAFSKKNPVVTISVTGGGSGTGLASLLNKEIDVANSSRPMKPEEWSQAKNNGINIQEFILARDGLAVIVHPENSVNQLTVEQIGKIYKGEIKNWQEVGEANGEIILYGRQSTSGTYVFFRDTVVKDDYAPSMRTMEGSQAIFQAVKTDRYGIGYIGIGYAKEGTDQKAKAGIKILAVSLTGSEAVSPLDKEAVLTGRYPIARPIFQYFSLPKANSLLADFLQFEAAMDGQQIIETAGFYRVSSTDAAKNVEIFNKITANP